jgi:hypothetical protein
VKQIDTSIEALVPSWLTLPEVAERLDVEVTRVRQIIRDRHLLAVRRGENNALYVPEAFISEGKVLKGLSGTLTVLADSGYGETESLRWLFTADETLPGSPVDALAENRGTEVKRRAQALGF